MAVCHKSDWNIGNAGQDGNNQKDEAIQRGGENQLFRELPAYATNDGKATKGKSLIASHET